MTQLEEDLASAGQGGVGGAKEEEGGAVTRQLSGLLGGPAAGQLPAGARYDRALLVGWQLWRRTCCAAAAVVLLCCCVAGLAMWRWVSAARQGQLVLADLAC